MKIISSFFASTRTMLVLLIVFGVSIALATFIENDFGTDSARKLVYNARWFEILLLLGAINIIGVAIKKNMFIRAKLSILLFHLAFVVIIIGAGITRYFGNEGMMHIREGETTNEWVTTNTYLNLLMRNGQNVTSKSFPVLFASASRNKFNKSVKLGGESAKVEVKNFIPQATQGIEFDKDGDPIVHFVTTTGSGRRNLIVQPGMSIQTSRAVVTYSEPSDSVVDETTVFVYDKQGGLYFKAPFNVVRNNMAAGLVDTLRANQEHAFLPIQLHNFQGALLVVKQFMPKAKLIAVPAEDEEQQHLSAVSMTITARGKSRDITVWGMKERMGEMQYLNFDNLEVGIAYGAIQQRLPFALRLNDFIIKRYPGSQSPSWFESNVQLIDPEKNIDREERIYMNHILKHRGYRFYQSSYDTDELGTVLSLNRDTLGTTISYLGYLLMGLGMLLSLINKKSRFGLMSRLSAVKSKAAIVFIGFVGFSALNIQAQEMRDTLPEIPEAHADIFGSILVQDNGGRIEPVNTLASEILRKVSRKETYKGQTPNQVILGMMVYPEEWQDEPMIKLGHKQIEQLLGLDEKYCSFFRFFSMDTYGGYALQEYVEEAYRKKPAYRSKFDNEIMRVDERVNICYLLYTGSLFKFFPDPTDTTHTWHSPLSAPEVFSGEDSVYTSLILRYYREEVLKAMETGNWDNADNMANTIKTFQEKYGEEVIPSAFRRNAESFYNNVNIFERLTNVYLLVGFILLLVLFIHLFKQGFSIKWIVVPSVVIISIAFLLHAFALGLRWYIAGHAPWSNGYEALTFIAWGMVLAGFISARRSVVSLAVAPILAGLILMTAHLSWMDPQITNLVPVLKSYWLVIHVATITISYSFFGLAALLAGFNLLVMFFQSPKNRIYLDSNISHITRIIEINLIIGIYLLTIGTFLGGIWANESWGRYWAWDPKETWALVTIIVYAIILHLRLIPNLKGSVLFNILSLWGFWSVIMTYFGVNYYLSGLHSYAAGDPLPIPPVVYYSVAIMFVISLLSGINQYRLNNPKKNAA